MADRCNGFTIRPAAILMNIYVTGFLALCCALRSIHLGATFSHNFPSANFSGVSATASILSITAA